MLKAAEVTISDSKAEQIFLAMASTGQLNHEAEELIISRNAIRRA